MKINLKLKFPKLEMRFKKHQREIMLVLAASMQTNRAMMFNADGADNGKKKWDPLVLRTGRPLQLTGALRKSWAPGNDGKTPGHALGSIVKIGPAEVSIGTNLAYARMMNDGTTKMPGGVLRAKNAQALKIPLPSGMLENGQKFMFRKSVRIPARPMDTLTKQDEKEFSVTMANYIAEILRSEAG